jgi:malate synthase
MDEILYELKDHSAGLNAGRWDYIFSIIKKFRNMQDLQLPDRSQITMSVPFMRDYAELLVHTCHKRQAHAIGGMAAFIPNRKNLEINEIALKKVREDKKREIEQDFDGTWVAHPDLVPVAAEMFQHVLGEHSHQKNKPLKKRAITAENLLDFRIPNGKITEEGIRQNISICLQYLESWLHGIGAVALNNLMEDTATAEISRSQLWQWIHHKNPPLDKHAFEHILEEEFKKLTPSSQLTVARDLISKIVLNKEFSDFLTLPAYPYINGQESKHV